MNKNTAWMKALSAGLAFLMVLTVFSAGLADQAVTPGLVEGVTWDTTPEEILEVETVSRAEDLIAAAYTEAGTEISILHPAEGDEPARQLSYAYKGGLLMGYGCIIASIYQPEGTDMAQYYDVYLQRFSRAYGNPADQDQARVEALYSSFITENVRAFITAHAVWDLGDDTVLFLLNMMDTNITYMFASESRLLAIVE
jgi:hypothetical protein